MKDQDYLPRWSINFSQRCDAFGNPDPNGAWVLFHGVSRQVITGMDTTYHGVMHRGAVEHLARRVAVALGKGETT